MKLLRKLLGPAERNNAVSDAEGTVFPVDAPASLPLPFTAVPTADELVGDAHSRVNQLSAAGGADEFCGDVFDTHYDRWLRESHCTAEFLAGEQRRVDRVLVDDAHHRAAVAHVRADRAKEVAERQDAAAGRLWSDVFD